MFAGEVREEGMKKMMTCGGCGSSISSDASSCPGCGRKFSSVATMLLTFSGWLFIISGGLVLFGGSGKWGVAAALLVIGAALAVGSDMLKRAGKR